MYKRQVDIVPLDSILKQHHLDGPMDFISIDVEGAELDVLKGFDIDRYKPRVVVIETNNELSEKEINNYLRSKGYTLARKTRANSFYVATESDVEKFNGVELNCIIEKQMHPLGAEYTIPSYLEGLVLYKGKATKIFKQLGECERQRELLNDCQKQIADSNEWRKESIEKNKKKNDQIKLLQNTISSYQEKVGKFGEWMEQLKDANSNKKEKIQFLENELNDVKSKLENLRKVSEKNKLSSGKGKEKLSDTWGVKLRNLLGKK